MRILIIHDRVDIGAELKRLANEAAGGSANVDVARDVVAAPDRLTKGFYDWLTIDLTLPMKVGSANVSLENTQLLIDESFAGTGVKAPADGLGSSKGSRGLDVVR